VDVGKKKLPRYNNAAETLVVTPPFTLPGVTARVFPLRASMSILRSFCDHYLNVAPEVCELRPYFPYVLLVVLDYGRMAIEQFNMGWVSQHEVFFEVPLAMWRRDRLGRPDFEKWVANTPFILVDNACSLTTGRESYGWPKVLATLQSSPERWLIDPRNPTRFLALDVKGADAEGSGSRLLDIEQQSGQNATLAPPDFEMIDPFARLSRLTRTSLTIGSDLAQLLLASPFSGFRPRHRADGHGDRRAVLFDSLRQLPGFLREPGLDVVTLKQFRDAGDPTQICYQALVGSRLSVARYNRGGLLGLYNVLQGDVSGGFNIRLYDNPAFPIIESLGLEVAQERTVRGRTVSFLKPFFPSWMSVDLTYGKGETICWRTRKGGWHVKGDRPPVGRVPPKKMYYNTLAGGAEQVWYGPYSIPEGSFDVYPLKANRKRLKGFLQRYLNTGGKLTFEPDGDHVFLVASANRMFSRPRSAAWLESRQIDFYVPLRWQPRDPSSKEKQALATPFAFVDNPVLATTLREVEGVPAINATIEAPARFLRRQGPLLTMQVDVFAALGAGLPSQRRTLLEVVHGESSSPCPVTAPRPRWLFTQKTDRLTLKQFRDADDPDRACYQSLVLEPWAVKRKPESSPKPFDHQVQIRIYRYPSLPLVDILGLESQGLHLPVEPDGAVADVLEPERPYRIELSVEIGLGRELAQTAGSLPWLVF
jgi:hypothetical protein